MNQVSRVDTDRRSLLKGVASLPLATVLANPTLAQAVGATLEDVSITTPDGRQITGGLAVPEVTPAPALLIIHEWWGLTDEVRSVTAEFAKEGFLALALDLYNGKVGSTVEEAMALRQGIDEAASKVTCAAWIDWLKTEPRSTGKVGTLGWCFGGGWSLNASLERPVDATVIYYGNVAKTAADLAPLAGDALGHFATLDRMINNEMVSGFEQAMNDAGKTYTVHWYEANHAFANPTGAAYDEDDAKVSWTRTLEFLNAKLK